MQQRYYDPVIGRFYSNDPIGFRDTHSFNRYAYANNNPYKYVDPTGMATDLGFCGVSGCDYSYKSGDSSSSDEDRKHYGQKNSNSSNSKSELSLTSLDEQKAVIVGIAEKLATKAAWTVDNSGIEYPDIPWLIPMLRGSAIHTEFSRSIDALGIPEFRGEGPSYLLGYQMPWGSLGSSRPDATFGPIDNPYLAFELKTGFLGMTKIQATRYQINLPSTTELVFIVPLQ